MKKTITLIFITLNFIACKKKNDTGCMPVDASVEAPQISAFCTANSINYTVDSNGIYYQVLDQGAGVKPNDNSVITVTYIATTLDGKTIEDKTSDPVTSSLSDFIEGWRLAIPYIQKGGHIKMVLPSSLAYGCIGIANVVAPNSPLYYDVVLVDVQ